MYEEMRLIAEAQSGQKDKKDEGKLRLSLVPMQMVRDAAKVRMWATENKYPDVNGWRNVSKERYVDALLRHILLYLEDPHGVDEESGLPHWDHICCNIAFIAELEEAQSGDKNR